MKEKNNPKIGEWPRMTGGGMFVSRVISDNEVELKHILAPWIVTKAQVFRWKPHNVNSIQGDLYCL